MAEPMKGRKRSVRKASLLCITVMAARIAEAAALTQSASAHAEAGDDKQAFEIALDIEPLLREANQALQAASLLHRMRKEA